MAVARWIKDQKGILMDFQIWLAFVAASIALLLIPGPTVLLVLSYALSQGKRVALATVGGVALGDLVAMSASLAGLGALVLASATLFSVLKWVGAGYLVYLGIKLFRSASTASLGDLEKVAETSASRVFGHAAAVTALNPKSIVFFIAFVPQFVVVDSPLLPQFAILVITFVGLAALNALAYALLADKLRAKIARPSVLAWVSRLGGSALIAMGVATAAFKRAQ
jgi:threonine/homoserine/homoserine lactone efflux protein